MKNIFCFLIITVFIILIFSYFTISVSAFNKENIKIMEYKVLNSYPHDPAAFTQGLEIYKKYLYEGTGLYGRSSLRKIDLQNGKILNKLTLDKKYFGEGITILNDNIYQLSWKENTAFVYDMEFNLIKKFNYQGEGWGLTNDNKNLIMSDGSEYLFFRNPETFAIIKKIKVQNNNKSIDNLNELEYHNNFIYANLWQTDYIIKINSQTGNVESYLDLSSISVTDYKEKINVLNGIAYDKLNRNFLITGKLWPKIYRIKIIE